MADDFVKQLQLTAMEAVLTETEGRALRKICQDLSREFNMDLARVEECSMEWILTHYYEWVYGMLEPFQLLEKAQELVESPEAKLARMRAEKTSLEETELYAEEIRKEQEARMAAAKEAMKGVENLAKLAEKVKGNFAKKLKDVELGGSGPSRPEYEEKVEIQRVDEAELKKDWDLF